MAPVLSVHDPLALHVCGQLCVLARNLMRLRFEPCSLSGACDGAAIARIPRLHHAPMGNMHTTQASLLRSILWLRNLLKESINNSAVAADEHHGLQGLHRHAEAIWGLDLAQSLQLALHTRDARRSC